MTVLFKSLPAILCAAALGATAALATADGPDYFQVTGVAQDDVLNIRATPSGSGTLLGSIPADANGIVNFGCVGGMDMQEWLDATEEERAAAAKTRWCKVGYDRTIGWSAGWFLTEGSEPDALNAGARLPSLQGSEWLLRDIAGTAFGAEAWIGFKSDGTVYGSGGCNRFTGSFEEAPWTLDRWP